VKFPILIVALAILTSCSEEDAVFVPSRIVSEPFTSFTTEEAQLDKELVSYSVDEVRTYKELEGFLRSKYGDIQPLPSIWRSPGIGDSGSSGPFSFRLSNGSEISINGLYDRETGQIVDPNFDLRSLPDIAIN